MQEIEDKKVKLEQKKHKLIAEEMRLKTKERKMRTRQLIEFGGLVVKAEFDNLPTNTLYGALLYLKNALLEQPQLRQQWTTEGHKHFSLEQKDKIAVILKFDDQPPQEIRSKIRQYSLKWNALRSEWYGYVENLESLKTSLANQEYDLQIFST